MQSNIEKIVMNESKDLIMNQISGVDILFKK